MNKSTPIRIKNTVLKAFKKYYKKDANETNAHYFERVLRLTIERKNK